MSRGVDQYLVATKLTMPQSYAHIVVPRHSLYQRLDVGVTRPLTLLAAPAGFGKTTLLCDWLRQHNTQAAWVSLGSSENDIERFWSYCLVALAQIHLNIAGELQTLCASLSASPLEEVLIAVINALFPLDNDIVLILDDYHAIENHAVHQSLLFFLTHMPAHVHLILSSRTLPPLPLARLRVYAQLIELRSDDLRFTREEAAALLISGMQLPLTMHDISALTEKTEGWIAGLQLAALSLRGQQEAATVGQFIGTFTGTNRYVLSYFAEEVLNSLSTELQDFVLMTSLLHSLTPSLCHAVTGQDNAEGLLQRLNHDNIFLFCVDEQGEWYRYHHLFAELLRYRLQQNYPERIAELHARASRWYENHAQLPEAIEHALAAHNTPYAADLIERCAVEMLLHGQIITVYSWLVRLSHEIEIAQRPILACLFSFLYLHAGETEISRSLLQRSEDAWQQIGNDEWLCIIASAKTYGALFRANGLQVLDYTRQAQQLAHGDWRYLHSLYMYQGAGYLLQGELQQAHASLLVSQHMHEQDNVTIAIPGINLYVGDWYAFQGKLREAVSSYTKGLPNGEQLLWFPLQSRLRTGDIYREWNMLAQAEECLQQTLPTFDGFTHAWTITENDILAARLAWLHDAQDRALMLLDKAEYGAHRLSNNLALARIATLHVHYLLEKGQPQQAQYWLEQHASTRATSEMQLLESELWTLAQARLLLAQQANAEALKLLQKLLPTIRAQGRIANEIEVYVLIVQAYAALGQSKQLRQALAHVLTLARPGGYLRIFLDEGQSMVSLLSDFYQQQKKYSIDSDILAYVHQLLRASGHEITPQTIPSWQQRRDDSRSYTILGSLSEREHEVLCLIAEGHSNQQIAHQLVVAESTIKTHLNNIYSKLNVNSRLQALTKAHAAGLFEH